MSKNLLFLGYDRETTRLFGMIEKHGWEVTHSAPPETDLSAYDCVLAFGYRHRLSEDALRTAQRPVLNLHMSYLPYNRGAHPNFWSFYDGTPSGVSIHEMDGTLDGGPVCMQRYVNFAPDENTFAATYARLFKELELLFCDHIGELLGRRYKARPQRGQGSYHNHEDLPGEMSDWDVDIATALAQLDQTFGDRRTRDMALVDEIQNVRSRNNVNWMDLLRIALRHAPEETKQVLRRINSDDGAISKLFEELGKPG